MRMGAQVCLTVRKGIRTTTVRLQYSYSYGTGTASASKSKPIIRPGRISIIPALIHHLPGLTAALAATSNNVFSCDGMSGASQQVAKEGANASFIPAVDTVVAHANPTAVPCRRAAALTDLQGDCACYYRQVTAARLPVCFCLPAEWVYRERSCVHRHPMSTPMSART